MMNKIFLILLFLHSAVCYTQELKSDTLSATNIEAVTINSKDYEKIEYSYGLKQEINFKLATVNPNADYELGLRFKNTSKKNGRISNVILFLHKSGKNLPLANLELNFYKVDSLTGRPLEKLNTEQIIFTPTSRKRGSFKINVEGFNIHFPAEGALVSVKWLPTEEYNMQVGPAIRLTNYKERLTYTRYNNDPAKWGNNFNFSKKPGVYTNAMIGLEVYIKRRTVN